MKILLLTTLVALAAADVNELFQQNPGYQYSFPQTSYGAPQGSILGNVDGSGSVQSIAYSSSGAAAVPQLTLPSVSGPTLKFNSGASSISGATIQTYDNGGFSTPVPLTKDALARYQVSTPAPSVDFSNIQVSTPSPIGGSAPSVNYVKYQEPASPNSYQFLSQLSQPSASSIGFNTARFGSDAALNSGSFDSAGQLNVGLGLGGSTGFPAESEFNSGLGLGGSQFVSKSSGFGGNINDAFGVKSDVSGSVDVSEQSEGHLEPEVSKHLYFFEAPEDEELEIAPKISLPPVAPKKTYKIIFIKAPSYRSSGTITIPAPPPSEEKTLVYVLVKKPESNTNVRFQSAAPAKPSKPEVFFIKYKTQKEAEAAVAEIQSKHGATGQVIANLPAGKSVDNIEIPANIGSSTAYSGSFGGSSFTDIGSPSPFSFSARSGGEDLPQPDSASAQSESAQSNIQFGKVDSAEPVQGAAAQVGDAQANVQIGQVDSSEPAQNENAQTNVQFGQAASLAPAQTFGQQSVSSFQGVAASSQSGASASGISESEEDKEESQPEVDSEDSEESAAPNTQDNESSSSQPEESEKNEEPEVDIQQRTFSQDSEGEGSDLSAFRAYGPPNPSLFKKYGPPDA